MQHFSSTIIPFDSNGFQEGRETHANPTFSGAKKKKAASRAKGRLLSIIKYA
jgi:hypothetical protein